MSWVYDGDDPGLRLFTAVWRAHPMPFGPGMRVLEVGCCEADWLHLAHAAWPDVDLVGIDTRAPDVVDGDGKVTRMRGDVMNDALFAPGSFDAVVSVSALEHVGLGHYRDPVDPDGDTKAMTNIWRWLKAGGWLYFDVPYNPERYEVRNTECRIYDDEALLRRLRQSPCSACGRYLEDCECETGAAFSPLWEGYCDSGTPDTLIDKPAHAADLYWYAAHVWQRAR